jgi:hypothetical protein
MHSHQNNKEWRKRKETKSNSTDLSLGWSSGELGGGVCLAASSSWRFRSSSSCLRFSSFNSNYKYKLKVKICKQICNYSISCIQLQSNSCNMDWKGVKPQNKLVLQEKTTDFTYVPLLLVFNFQIKYTGRMNKCCVGKWNQRYMAPV